MEAATAEQASVTTEHISKDSIPDIYVPMKVAEELMATNRDRLLLLAENGRIRVRRAPGGHRRFSLRDALTLATGA
jgi:hypothetical protein